MDYRQLGLTPISDDAPSGENVRDALEYDYLAIEIEKKSSVHTDEGPDWAKVVDLSGRLLSEKGKDLLVASYLCAGLLILRNVEGLSESLTVYADLLETHWDGLFPSKKRMRGRVAAVEWWMDQVERFLKTEELQKVEAATFEALQKEVDRLQKAVVERFPEPPSLQPLVEFLNVLPVQQSEKEEDPREESRNAEAPPSEDKESPAAGEPKDPADPKKTAQPSTSEQVTVPASAEEARKMAAAGLTTLRKAADSCLDLDPADPESYRWRRLAVWTMAGLPPNDHGISHIPAPDTNLLSVVKTMQDNGNWNGLLHFAEERLSQFAFWLDLNRLADTALEMLGTDYEPARQVVQQETSLFLQRLPGIEAISFAGDMPFADGETRAWLSGLQQDGGPSSGGSGPAEDPESRVLRLMAELRRPKLQETLTALSAALQEAPAGEQRTLCRLAMVRVLAGGKKPFLSLPVVEAVLEDLERHDIAAWDPATAVFALQESHAALIKIKDQEAGKRLQQILAAITRLDPALALKMVGG